MNCQIYISFYSLKNKYLDGIFCDFPYRNETYIKAHSYREYCYFTPWELYIEDFNPESYSHMKWLNSYLREHLPGDYWLTPGLERCYFVDPKVIDWFPPITVKQYSQIPCLKVVCNKEIVDMNPYIKKFWRNFEDKRHRKNKEWQEDCYRKMPYMIRHFKTTQEKRNQLSPQEKRELADKGIYIKERYKRNSRHLPDLYDDITPNIYGFCWKDISKDRHQYNTNQNSKKKQIRGEYYKSKRPKKS